MESISYVLSFRMVFFYLVTTSCIFDISLHENSINQIDGDQCKLCSIKNSFSPIYHFDLTVCEKPSNTSCFFRSISLKRPNLNVSRPSEHPTQQGEKTKTLSTWDHRLQKDKIFSWHLNGCPDGSKIGSTVKCRGEAHRYTVHLLTLIAMQGHQKSFNKLKHCSSTYLNQTNQKQCST